MQIDRTRFRREANKADNKAATVAVDSLINFEAVKVRESTRVAKNDAGIYKFTLEF